MKQLVFATNNAHKLSEVRAITDGHFAILSLDDIGCHDDIPETADTLEGNALQKARYIAERYHVNCFADDTGLEVEALGGQPGVHTARYAYPDRHDPEANTRKLLDELGHQDVYIESDGNITCENAAKLYANGSDIFVAGTSSIFREGNIDDLIMKLRKSIGW